MIGNTLRDLPETVCLSTQAVVRARPRHLCLLCDQPGRVVYSAVTDWLWGVDGQWNIRECPGCILGWLDPEPIDEDILKLYSKYYTHRAPPATRFDALRKEVLDHILPRLGYPSKSSEGMLVRFLSRTRSWARAAAMEVMDLPASMSGNLLDIGCGSGEFLLRMQSLGWKVTGVEPDRAAANYARSRGLEVLHGDISDVSQDAAFDVITMNHVIEHVADPVVLLRQCAKRLRGPHSRLVITTPNIQSLGHRWFRQHWRGLEVPRHLNLFSSKSLGKCVETAGLRVQSCRTETRMARMIYNPSTCAKAGQLQVGTRTDFSSATKTAAYCFQAVEDLWVHFNRDVGEEVYISATRDGYL